MDNTTPHHTTQHSTDRNTTQHSTTTKAQFHTARHNKTQQNTRCYSMEEALATMSSLGIVGWAPGLQLISELQVESAGRSLQRGEFGGFPASSEVGICKGGSDPAPPNYPLRYPIHQPVETIRPLIEVHWGVEDGRSILFCALMLCYATVCYSFLHTIASIWHCAIK